MFYCTEQPHTSSIPVGLVKSESNVIVRSIEAGLERWALVVAVIIVGAYPFLAFSDQICCLKDTQLGIF